MHYRNYTRLWLFEDIIISLETLGCSLSGAVVKKDKLLVANKWINLPQSSLEQHVCTNLCSPLIKLVSVSCRLSSAVHTLNQYILTSGNTFFTTYFYFWDSHPCPSTCHHGAKASSNYHRTKALVGLFLSWSESLILICLVLCQTLCHNLPVK